MNHLTVDEIIDFVSSSELNDEVVALSTRVNGHIRNCDKCLKLVNAFQTVYDEFVTMSTTDDFKNYLYIALKKRNEKKFLGNDETLNLEDFR